MLTYYLPVGGLLYLVDSGDVAMKVNGDEVAMIDVPAVPGVAVIGLSGNENYEKPNNLASSKLLVL